MSPAASRTVSAALSLVVGIAATGCEQEPVYPERAVGTRAPVTASCDEASDLRCMLPWPSNTYARVDKDSKTGLRLALSDRHLPSFDDVTSINRGDGFSRNSTLLAGFKARLGDVQGSCRLIVAQHDHPSYGQDVPLWTWVEQRDEFAEALLLASPLGPMLPNADHVAVVLKSLRKASGAALKPLRPTLLALGLVAAKNPREHRRVAYHAPTRLALQKAGIDFSDILMVWEFTTRSQEDPTKYLLRMQQLAMESIATPEVQVVVDRVRIPGVAGAAAVVEGRLTGLPQFLNEARDSLVLDSRGLPLAAGYTDAPFRIVIPLGSGDYRVVMYGHGTGGGFDDSTLDAELAALGAAKVGVRFRGWTSSEIIATWTLLGEMFAGIDRSTSHLLQSLSEAAAIQEALWGPLGDVLAASFLGDQRNPAASRRPDPDTPLWAGGSLGGTMGMVYSSAHPDIQYGVLNVPGAAWTHWIPMAYDYGVISLLYVDAYGGRINLLHATSMAQGNWDPVDGASWLERWRGKNGVWLIQESVGDPILPNRGSDMVAICASATHVGAVIQPVYGLENGERADNKSGITQFLVPQTWSDLDIHGFTSKDNVAGQAAREQIYNFMSSVWSGAPEITVPAACAATNDGSCNFSDM